MTDDEKIRDFLKEDLKSNYEYLRTYSLFILGLCTSEGTLLLRNDLYSNDIVVLLIILNSKALFVIFGFTLTLIVNISLKIDKLKKI